MVGLVYINFLENTIKCFMLKLFVVFVLIIKEVDFTCSSSYNLTPLIYIWFFAYPRDQRTVTCLENVHQLNKWRGKKLGFQLSHRQPLKLRDEIMKETIIYEMFFFLIHLSLASSKIWARHILMTSICQYAYDPSYCLYTTGIPESGVLTGKKLCCHEFHVLR